MAVVFNSFKKNTRQWLTILFCTYWLFVVVFDFIGNSSDYVFAFRFFEYWDFLIVAYITGFLISLFFVNKSLTWNSIKVSNFRNLYFYPILLVFMTMTMWFYFSKNNLEFSVFQFIIKTLLIHFSVVIVLVASVSAGAFLLKIIHPPLTLKSNIFLQISIGFAILSFGIFVLGVINQLNWLTASIWLLVLILAGWKSLALNLKEILWKKHQKISLNPFSIFLIITAIILVSINLITVTSPFPIGFDSLTLYMNIPKLLNSYGGLIEGLYPYNWSLVVSLGYVIFGSNAVALHLGSVSSILLIFLIFKIARSFVSTDWAIFSAVIFYTLPIVVWPSSIEIKTDLAMFFIMLTVLHIVFEFYFGELKNEPLNISFKIFDNEAKLWLVSGILIGFSLGIKFTSLLAVIGIVVFLFYYYYGKFAAIASLITIVVSVLVLNLYTFTGLSFSSIEILFFSFALIVVAFIFLFLAKKKGRITTIKPLKLLFILMISSSITLLPWGIKNAVESKSLNISELIKGSESLSAKYNIDLKHFDQHKILTLLLPQALSSYDEFDKNNENDLENYTAKKEEIERYLGYEGGFMRFLSLPYDLTNKVNVDLFSTDISFLFLAFIPLILLSYNRSSILPFLIRIAFLVIWFSLSFWSAHNPDNSLNIYEIQDILLNKNYGFGSGFSGIFVTVYSALIYPFLILGSLLSPLYSILTFDNDLLSIAGVLIFSALCYYLFKGVLTENLDLKSNSLLLFIGAYFVFWIILSSGIPWYGMIGFGLLPLILAKFLFTNKTSIFQKNKLIKGLSFSLIIVWVFMLLLVRISPLSLGKNQNPDLINYKTIFLSSSALYASGQVNETRAFNTSFNVETRRIIRELNENKNSKILNVGSLFTFFIDKNDKRVFSDNQLDYFSSLWRNSENNKITTTYGLKQRGFDYILIDLEAHTLDNTPEQSLVIKVIELFDYLNNNPYVELISTDRIVTHPQGDRQIILNGNTVKVKNDVFGINIIEQGKTALFKINF
jgi:hypothetical protein